MIERNRFFDLPAEEETLGRDRETGDFLTEQLSILTGTGLLP